jgi:glycosyltransferase involved in cell wall biosynthesis
MGPCLGTVIRIVKWKLPNVTVIALTDNVIPHEKRFGDSIFTKYFLKPCDGFIAMSKSVLNDIKSFVNNKPMLFSPHPVYDTFGDKISLEEARKKLNISNDQKVVLFFGIIRKYKGLELLLQAFAIEKVKKLNLKLLIAGEFYDDSQPYLDFIESHQLKNNIVLSNAYIPFEEVKNYFCASNLVVQPYLTATQSGVTQIAYHFNKPMIVTNVGGLPEMVENGVSGYVVNTNPIEIADSIENYFVLNKENEFTENVKVEKKKFDWEYMILTVNNLWTEIRNKAK